MEDFRSAVARARRMTGSINSRLDVVAAACEVAHPDYTAAIAAMVARLAASGAGSAAPAIGDEFPDFILPDQNGRLARPLAKLAEGPVVLSFHRGAWCDFCQLNMLALQEVSGQLADSSTTLFAIAPEGAGRTSLLADQAGATFPILSDVGLSVSTLLGLTVAVDADLQRELVRLDIDIDVANGGAGWLLPIPATFVVGTGGLVVARHVEPDPRRRMDIEAMLQAVDARS